MKKKSVYDSVTNEKRVKLIQMVNEGEKLNRSAQTLNINYSTAKTILRIYRNERRIFKKIPTKLAPIKKKVFSIERGNSTQISNEDKKSPETFLSPKSAFKRVGRQFELPRVFERLEEFNFYLNVKMTLMAEITRNQNIINNFNSLMNTCVVGN
jgi:hypothetical protein